jgi:hypothetical protein
MKPDSILFPLFVLGMIFGFLTNVRADSSETPTLSEVVLFGVRSVFDLNPNNYPEEPRKCLKRYLRAVPPNSILRRQNAPLTPEEAVRARRRNLQEQIVVLIGRPAEAEAGTFAAAVPLYLEWEGLSEGPLDEAEFARQWLHRYPETFLRPFLHLFIAHRLRAGYEAARRESAKGLWPILAERYKKEIAIARSSTNKRVACIAIDLEAQSHVYLAGFGRP